MTDYVRTSGPLFDGRALAALDRGVHAIRGKVAAEGEHLAAAAFTASIRDNHGRFVSRFTTTDEPKTYTTQSGRKSYTLVITTDSNDETIVTNDIASYGPWLEGTGSRNATTRFKGHHGMRRAGQQLDGVAEVIANEAIRPYVAEMNG